jgi:hypothetical protein
MTGACRSQTTISHRLPGTERYATLRAVSVDAGDSELDQLESLRGALRAD